MSGERAGWFRNAVFGGFIHWGLYCIPAGSWKGRETDYFGEWIQARLRIPAPEYAELAKEFNPTRFNPDEWCRLFRDAGMKYAVFTAKHHEGFSMYGTAVSPFDVVNATPFGRDVLAEVAASCRKYGLKLGIYYSHDLDWHEADGGDPGPFEEKNVDGVSWGNDWDFPDCSKKEFKRYFYGKVVPQITELLTRYGEVSVLWLDCPVSIAKEESLELRNLVRRLQPDCLISGRIGNGCGDFISLGDNQLPGTAIPGLVECPATLNDTWGFKRNDHHWKTAETVIGQLLELAEKRVNYLLNVGPRPDGALPPETVRILREIARWRQENDDAFENVEGNPFPQIIEGVRVLAGEGKMNLFLKHPEKETILYGIRNKILSANVPFRQDADALSLDTSSLQGVWPRAILRFEGKPEIDPVPPPSNGCLILPPPASVCEDPYAPWNIPEKALQWEIRFPRIGAYSFSCVTESGLHSRPWTGARRVEISVNGEHRNVLLEAKNPAGKGYYPRAESFLGVFNADVSGPARISLRTLELLSPEAETMNFISLKIQCQNQTEPKRSNEK